MVKRIVVSGVGLMIESVDLQFVQAHRLTHSEGQLVKNELVNDPEVAKSVPHMAGHEHGLSMSALHAKAEPRILLPLSNPSSLLDVLILPLLIRLDDFP